MPCVSLIFCSQSSMLAVRCDKKKKRGEQAIAAGGLSSSTGIAWRRMGKGCHHPSGGGGGKKREKHATYTHLACAGCCRRQDGVACARPGQKKLAPQSRLETQERKHWRERLTLGFETTEHLIRRPKGSTNIGDISKAYMEAMSM